MNEINITTTKVIVLSESESYSNILTKGFVLLIITNLLVALLSKQKPMKYYKSCMKQMYKVTNRKSHVLSLSTLKISEIDVLPVVLNVTSSTNQLIHYQAPYFQIV